MYKRTHLLVLMIVVLLILPLFAEKSTERLAREKGVEAEELWEQGKYVESAQACMEAIDLFTKAVTDDSIPQDPDLINHWLMIAFDSNVKSGNLDKGLEVLDKLIAFDKGNMKLYNQKALIQKKLNKFDDALETYFYIDSVKPSYKNCNKIGDIYKKREDWENALTWYNKSYDLRQDSDTIKDIAVINLYLGRQDDAIKAYQEFLATDPSTIAKTKTYKNLGKLYEDSGNIDKALENYEMTNQLRYDSQITLLLISKYYELKKFDKSMEKINLYLEKKPDGDDAIYYRAMIKYDRGELVSAKSDFEKIKDNPTYANLAKGYIESINSQ